MHKEIKMNEEDKKKLVEGLRKTSEKYLFGSKNPKSQKIKSKN